jgi:hypothetical protein
MDVNKLVAGMFFLILVFIIVSRASDFNTIVKSVGGVVTAQTQALQGVSTFGNATLIQGVPQNNLLGF